MNKELGADWYMEPCGMVCKLPTLTERLQRARKEIDADNPNRITMTVPIQAEGAYRMGCIMSGFGHPFRFIQSDKSLRP